VAGIPPTVRRARRIALTGIGVSPGIAIGHVHLVDRRKVRFPTHHIQAREVEAELLRVDAGFVEAQLSLNALKERVIADGGAEHTPILDAHLLMMQDPMLTEGSRRQIVEDRKCAEWAVRSTVREIKRRFDALGDHYFRERRSDIDFVGERVLQALTKDQDKVIDRVPEDAIVVAHDLSPADALALLRRKVRAFVTEVGGATSHTAILARALEIPAVVGCARALEVAGRGDDVVVDGTMGEVVLHPSRVLRAKYRGIARRRQLLDDEVLAELPRPTRTTDGYEVTLLANIELEDEVESALAHGARGVGLYRTEFLYLNHAALPSEEEHALAYTRVLDALEEGQPALFRTFDLGSDKMSARVMTPKEDNPAMGLRACRLGLAREDLFRAQLRGMLRATGTGRGSIMFPMISGVSELRQVKALLHDEMDRLEREGVPVWREVPVGIMVELPSAVWVADHLAEECDFFSIGTNDLIQYSLAIDRGNEHVAYLYKPLHISNLRAIRHVIEAGKGAGIPVSLCGEMAADPLCTAVCIALGFKTLSMPQAAIPRVAWAIRRLEKSGADALLERCLSLSTVDEVEAHVHEIMRDILPDLASRE
jgi:phosphoenolpyruvate-protein phosphotransferase (PTS system enzyme I)